MLRSFFALVVAAGVAACATSPPPAGHGSRDTVRLRLPPSAAAACFARNAEEHSSALVAEVRTGGDSAETIVRVKNGVLYGTARFERAGAGSSATIALMVSTTGRRGDLLDALTEGC